jgi:hypothetical protein
MFLVRTFEFGSWSALRLPARVTELWYYVDIVVGIIWADELVGGHRIA